MRCSTRSGSARWRYIYRQGAQNLRQQRYTYTPVVRMLDNLVQVSVVQECFADTIVGMKERRRVVLVVTAVLAALTLVMAYRIRRMRDDPSALPYEQRLWTEFPRPFVTRARLREMLMLEGNARVLEVGPGTGYYTLHVASWLWSGGTLQILDIQEQMLEHTMRRAREIRVENIIPTQGDAQELPYQDNAFDAAYLVATLGEVPEQQRALEELRRVLKPGGRLVVGEGQPDPHMVGFQRLQGLAEAAGLDFEQRIGGPLGYFARFKVS
jgi:SAM-dependent methyltransferase